MRGNSGERCTAGDLMFARLLAVAEECNVPDMAALGAELDARYSAHSAAWRALQAAGPAEHKADEHDEEEARAAGRTAPTRR